MQIGTRTNRASLVKNGASGNGGGLELKGAEGGAGGSDRQGMALARDSGFFTGDGHGCGDTIGVRRVDQGENGRSGAAQAGADRTSGSGGFAHRDQVRIEACSGRLMEAVVHAGADGGDITCQQTGDESA